MNSAQTSLAYGLFKLYFMSLLFSFFFVEFHLDPEYKRFLENYSCDEEKSMANPEILLGEIEAKTRELIGTISHILDI